jgi:hypothetical protein
MPFYPLRRLALIALCLLPLLSFPVRGGGLPGNPADPVAGAVLGQTIRTRDVEELRYHVLRTLSDRLVKEEKIEVAAEEIQAYNAAKAKAMAKVDTSPPDNSPETQAVRAEIARAVILQWKVNRALYQRFGGRIAYQQGGPEPLDATRRFLEDARARGDFTLAPGLDAAFWGYYRDDARHSFYPAGSAAEAAVFGDPPWLQP